MASVEATKGGCEEGGTTSAVEGCGLCNMNVSGDKHLRHLLPVCWWSGASGSGPNRIATSDAAYHVEEREAAPGRERNSSRSAAHSGLSMPFRLWL